MSKQIYNGNVVKLWLDDITLPNGNNTTLEIIRHPGASAVLPVFDNNEVILIKQYRYAAAGFIYEVPAGKLDPGETPEICAKREMEEETGFRAKDIKHLTTIFTTPGFTDEIIHLYYATGLEETKQDLQGDEVIEVIKMPFKNAMKMIENGEITDGKTIITIMLAYQKLISDQ